MCIKKLFKKLKNKGTITYDSKAFKIQSVGDMITCLKMVLLKVPILSFNKKITSYLKFRMHLIHPKFQV